MLIGEYRHNLDDKGRLQIPAKWRPRLAEGAVITKGFDGSLALYPRTVWEEKAADLAALPQNDPKVRAFVRHTLAGAVYVEMDKLGRILLPGYLRDFSVIKKEALLAGLFDHVEIWNITNWDKQQGTYDFNSPEAIESLKESGV